jgi:HAMP domain-containing protein
MHGLGKKAYGWYRDFTHFSIFIYLSEELINSMVYPRQFCEQNYNPASRQNFFLINEKNLKIFPQPTERIQKNLIIQLQKSIKFTPSEMLRSTNHLFAFQRLKENWWGAAVIDTTGFARPDFNSSSLLIRCIAIVILMVFLRQCYLLVYPDPFSSIKWKLLAIFIFTVAIPVAIFSTLGYEHLLQARKHAETEKSLELIQLHNRMDKKFNNFLSDRANVITEFIENSFEKAVEEKDFETFASSLVKSFNADAILVMDQNGESLISEELSNSRVSMTLMKNLVKDLFEFLNKRKPSASNHLQSISSNFVLNFAKANRIIRRFNIISMSAYHFLYAFKDSSRPYYPYCIQLFWKTSKVHRDFFRQFSPNHNSSNQLISMLFDADNSNLISETRVKWNNIQSFLKQTTIRGINIQTCHLDSGEKYLAAGVKARNMTDIVGITLLDFSVIENEILRLKVIFAAIIVIILLMSLALYRILNFQILFPVNQLVDGVENIKDGNYNFRLKINFSNELGKLGNSINVTAENLQELAVARVVQDALIPDKIPEFPGCSLYAQTMPMSKLGGDYYDFFITSNNTLVAFLADVAGHGVQAGLIMAMAKTVLMLGKEQNHSIERIMNNLNSTFFKLRRSEIRTMLTAQIFEFFPDKNSFSFINAGHCFPLIFYNKADHGSFIDRGSYPLGFKKDRIFQHEKFEFDKGASLILYTDGILESVNESGKILGETGLKRIVKKSFENNLKKFCQNLFYEYSNWSDNQSDDITFFLIRKDMNEK